MRTFLLLSLFCIYTFCAQPITLTYCPAPFPEDSRYGGLVHHNNELISFGGLVRSSNDYETNAYAISLSNYAWRCVRSNFSSASYGSPPEIYGHTLHVYNNVMYALFGSMTAF